MRFTIDTDIIESEGLFLGEFLALLIPYNGYTYKQCYEGVKKKKLAEVTLNEAELVLSENTRKKITRILTKSSEDLRYCTIDFEDLAAKLQLYYPSGNKPGTTHPWRGKVEDIAQKLRLLVMYYKFEFTEEEAVNAVREYTKSFKDYKYMALLPYFILRTEKDETEGKRITSHFMTIIENNREKKNENHN